MAAPKKPDMDKCTPKKTCQFGEHEGVAYDPADPCEEGYSFNEETCSCDPSEACDCNCHDDCPECELCGADGKCYPDPACAPPTTGQYYACLAELEDIGSGITPVKFAASGPLAFSGYEDEPVAVGFSISSCHPDQSIPGGWYKQSSVEIIVPKANCGSIGTAWISPNAVWPDGSFAGQPRRDVLSLATANTNYDRRVTVRFEIYDTMEEADNARNCWDDRLTYLCNQ